MLGFSLHCDSDNDIKGILPMEVEVGTDNDGDVCGIDCVFPVAYQTIDERRCWKGVVLISSCCKILLIVAIHYFDIRSLERNSYHKNKIII